MKPQFEQKTWWNSLDIARSAEPAGKGRDLGLRQTNSLNSRLRISLLGTRTVCMDFRMLRQKEPQFLVDSDGLTDLECVVVSNLAGALYFL